MATGSELDAPPDGHGHNSVVDDMECGHLVVSFAQHEEERVKELCELGEEVPPGACSHPLSLRPVHLDRLATETVSVQPPGNASLVEDPRTEDDLDGIVNDEHASQLERFAVLHPFWAQNLR